HRRPPTTVTPSLHDALPISGGSVRKSALVGWALLAPSLLLLGGLVAYPILYNFWLSLFAKHAFLPAQTFVGLGNYRYFATDEELDRKSTRLNSSHLVISYAV